MSLGIAYFLGPTGQTLDLFKSFVNTSQKAAPYSGLLSNDQALWEHSRPSNESFRKKVNVLLTFPELSLYLPQGDLVRADQARAGGHD